MDQELIVKITHHTLTTWIEALRSGKYEQGSGALERNEKFCCLGVLAKEMDIPYNPVIEGENEFNSNIYNSLGKGLDLMGLSSDTLIDLNDREQLSFKSIADYIESTYDEWLFRSEGQSSVAE
jgi:hypothetical protein